MNDNRLQLFTSHDIPLNYNSIYFDSTKISILEWAIGVQMSGRKTLCNSQRVVEF